MTELESQVSMFDQTFLDEPKTARKPYSMVVSLMLQIVAIAILCLLPFVFPQVLPVLQLKSVLAAPPRPPAVVHVNATTSHSGVVGMRTRRVIDLVFVHYGPIIRHSEAQTIDDAPITGGSEVVGDPNGVPFALSDDIAKPIPPKPAPVKPVEKRHDAIRVGTMSAASLIRMVQPVYPQIAKSTHVEGTVEFTATISREGAIENLALVHGHPLLINAAREAVLQWRYKPTLLNGEPVEVITDIVVNFRLSQ